MADHNNMFKLSDELIEAKNNYHLEQEKKETENISNHEETHPALEKTEDEIYLSNYPRIMTICSTVSNLYNIFAEVIPDDISQQDLLEKTEQGLETYKQGREFFNIVICHFFLFPLFFVQNFFLVKGFFI